MARVLMVLGSGFIPAEIALKTALEKKGHNVRIAGVARTPETAKDGTKVTPDMALYEASPEYFEFVIVVGEDIKNVARPEIITLIRRCAEKKGVAGVNGGAVLLAFAGVLNGKKATVAPSEKSINFLRDSGAIYSRDEIVVDGKILTAIHPEATEQIAAAIERLL